MASIMPLESTLLRIVSQFSEQGRTVFQSLQTERGVQFEADLMICAESFQFTLASLFPTGVQTGPRDRVGMVERRDPGIQAGHCFEPGRVPASDRQIRGCGPLVSFSISKQQNPGQGVRLLRRDLFCETRTGTGTHRGRLLIPPVIESRRTDLPGLPCAVGVHKSCTPVTFVDTGRNSPRISAGASGFRSIMSI